MTTTIIMQMPPDSNNEPSDAELETLASQLSEDNGGIFRGDALMVLRELRHNRLWKLVRRD